MAPTKKSRTVKKRFSSLSDVSPDKDVSTTNKTVQRKRKLSDKLGSQWSKEELERFYDAYRKHGKDWKKVAAVVRNRSIEMVEALYNMNRAYLSLPEGTASVVGLIAMMTDHYNVLDGSDSGRESNGAPGISQKRRRAKVQLNILKEDHSQSQPVPSNDGCLSLLKRRRTDGIQPRAVGKRTPRFPVSYAKKEDRDNYASPNKRGRKSEVDDDEVAHVAALALTEASKRGGSPQVSQTPQRRTEHTKSSPVQSWERMCPQSETAQAKLGDASIDEEWGEGRRTRGEENGGYARDSNSLMHMEGVGTVEVHRKVKKVNRKKDKVEDTANNQYDDGGEACSATEGLNVCASRGKDDMEVSNVKSERFSPQGQRKRSKKLFFGVSVDESSALDALHTLAGLADLSQTMPASTLESESSVQLKDERMSLDLDDKSSVREATSTSGYREKIKLLGAKEKAIHASSGVQGSNSRKSKLGRDSLIDVNVLSQTQQPLSANKTSKRKRKFSGSKVSNADTHLESRPSELESEDVSEEGNKSGAKAKLVLQISGPIKQRKSTKLPEGSFSSDPKRVDTDLSVSTPQVLTTAQVNLPTMQRSRRKLKLPRTLAPEERKFSESHNLLKCQPNKCPTSLPDGSLYLKKKLLCYLSSHMARRWCTFEWFYSAIDFPWFAKSEFVEYLNHVGLGHIPRLTRVEWGVIRSSLGKPRRFSENFLCEEREKLKQYRESVRKHYAELRNGMREGLPTDLARPLSVGQRVVALHPKTREVYNGSVLTVDHDKCRVQFDRPEMGVEFVMDIDCMPSNPLDNMPEALRRQSIATDKFSGISKEQQANGYSNFGGSMMYASSGHVENVISPMNTSVKLAKGDGHHTISQTKAAVIDSLSAQQAASCQPYTVAHVQAREADVRALSEMTRALDKKEALLLELRNRNNEVLQNQTYGDSSLKDSEVFKKHYATVLVQLREASDQVANALHNLRERNTYPGNPLPPWLKPPFNSSFPGGIPSLNNNSFASQEPASKVVQIVKGSRAQAHAMVDAAIQAMSLIKGEEDAFTKIGEALDSLDTQQLPSDSKPTEQVTTNHQNQLASYMSEPNPSSNATGPVLNDSNKNETQIPSELITSCVSTLLMIQTCTERQYPPAEVAQILDFAVTTLKPCCDQNQPIYREIQMSMGRLKTQILALIPTSI